MRVAPVARSAAARRFVTAFVAAASFALAFLGLTPAARAERELIVPFHESGHLVFDQLSGMRLSAASGFSYAGPAGVAFRSQRAEAARPGQSASETKTTTLWLSPSFDVFVTDHLSIGGLIEIAHTYGSVESGGQTLELPGTTSMTFLPRLGFYVPFGDRFGIWPRAGVGWSSAQAASFPAGGGAPVSESFQSLVLDMDLALVYRFTESFFMRGGPQIGTTLGGRRTEEQGGTSAAAGASALQISGMVGFGVNLEL